jgi:hypothetical protein
MGRLTRILRDYGPGILKYGFATNILSPLIRLFGFVVLTDHFYHPIPSRCQLRDPAGRERALELINYRPAQQVTLATELLPSFAAEINDRSVIGASG